MCIRDRCGAKVFKKSVVPVVYQEAFLSKWLFDVEIFLRLKKALGKEQTMQCIVEQPLMRWVHVDDSKLDAKDALEIPMRLAHIWLNYNVFSFFSITHTAAVADFNIETASPELAIAA